jgi:protein-disulfide isomerase
MLNKMLIPASCLMLLVAVTALVYAADSGAPAPIQSVMTPYLQIHDALAKDSMDGVSAAATALGKAARNDKMFPSELGQEAQTLAQAKDLGTARAAFKPLSETLIKVLDDNHVKSGAYVEAYCPMEKARWLQTGTTVSNPFGASMATCGSIVSGKAEPAAKTGGCCN